jgi:protein involved in polysaccharide export with SLBB domain
MKVAVLMAILYLSVQSQTQTKKSSDLFEDKTQTKLDMQSLQTLVPVLEGPIDAEKYIVGPSDILAVNIWTMPPMNLVLTVTPEGTIIVPTVNEIKITGLTLSEAKRRIITEIQKKYFSSNPTVTLLNPRKIAVIITGNVRFPCRYVMSASERIGDLIQEANKVTRRTEDKTIAEDLQRGENPDYHAETASKRDIQVRRRDGTKLRADIQKYFGTKDDRWNPFLLEGDEVFVPRSDIAKNILGIYGAVNMPGRYEFIEGDSLLDGINLAYGFNKRANLDSIIHVRLDPKTGVLNTTAVSVAKLFPGSPYNFSLEPGDRIVVKENVDLREDDRVFVEGEVVHPGIYPITKNSTRLSEVVQQAGGLTEYASLKSAELLRQSVVVDDGQLDRMVRQKSNITPEDNIYVTVEGDTRIRRNNVNVDFEKLFSTNGESQDVVLQSEDRIIIPSVRKTVYVFGQVSSPGNIPFVAGKDVDYYIECTGGYTSDAQKGDVAVIKWATRQWFEPDETQIQEGDFIWVPPVVKRPASYWLTIVGQTASIVSVALSIVILVLQINK